MSRSADAQQAKDGSLGALNVALAPTVPVKDDAKRQEEAAIQHQGLLNGMLDLELRPVEAVRDRDRQRGRQELAQRRRGECPDPRADY